MSIKERAIKGVWNRREKEQRKKYDKAIEKAKKEAERAETNETHFSYHRALAKVAELEFKAGKYKEAAQTYEKAADKCIYDSQVAIKQKYRRKADEIYSHLLPQKHSLRFKGKMREHGLADKVTAIIGIVGFVGAILFLSSNITGNAIGTLTQTTSNYVGVILLIIGIVGAFFYFRKK